MYNTNVKIRIKIICERKVVYEILLGGVRLEDNDAPTLYLITTNMLRLYIMSSGAK